MAPTSVHCPLTDCPLAFAAGRGGKAEEGEEGRGRRRGRRRGKKREEEREEGREEGRGGEREKEGDRRCEHEEEMETIA